MSRARELLQKFEWADGGQREKPEKKEKPEPSHYFTAERRPTMTRRTTAIARNKLSR